MLRSPNKYNSLFKNLAIGNMREILNSLDEIPHFNFMEKDNAVTNASKNTIPFQNGNRKYELDEPR